VSLFLLILTGGTPAQAEYTEMRGVIDVRSQFSDGEYTIDQLAKLARARGIDVLFMNDHDLLVMEYGLPPFRHLLKRSYERNSILHQGAAKYLRTIDKAEQNNAPIIIIPGSETAPFYFWTGTPWGAGLTAHNYERRLLTVGLTKPADYQSMPIIHNRLPFALTNIHTAALLYLGAAILSCILCIWPGKMRIVGGVTFLLALLLFLNSDPLRASPFNAYSGDQEEAPYNLAINYVTNRGGLVFWNYPETRSGVHQMGPVKLKTLPYPEMLLKTRNYTGFSALYGDTSTITEPGNIWDMVLNEYCTGYRTWPPWAIATSDYHGEGKGGDPLGSYTTVMWVQERSRAGVLAAMQHGHMYACATPPGVRMKIDEFSLSSPDGKVKGISGDEVTFKGAPHITIRLSVSGTDAKGPLELLLIRSGKLVATQTGDAPLSFSYEDPNYRPGEKMFYRFEVRGKMGRLISNPIFVTFAR